MLNAIKAAFAFGLLSVLLAGNAVADPGKVNYEILMSGEESVCGFFDAQGANSVSFDQIGLHYINKGFSSSESAEIVFTSVQEWCSQYLPALRAASSSVDSGRPDWFNDKQWRYVQRNSDVMCHVLTAYPDGRGMFESQVDIAIHEERFTRDEAVYMILQAVKDNCPDLYRHWEQNPLLPAG